MESNKEYDSTQRVRAYLNQECGGEQPVLDELCFSEICKNVFGSKNAQNFRKVELALKGIEYGK